MSIIPFSGIKAWRGLYREMELLEKYLEQVVISDDPKMSESARHIIRAGGKRVRPAFADLSAKVYGCEFERLLPLMAALELTHTASLLHDDVIDGAQTRRGLPTLNNLEGNKIAVHTGDVLISAAMRLMSSYNDQYLVDVLNDTVREMCLGELRQLDDLYDVNQDVRRYFYRIQRKTALLFACSGAAGAYISGAPPQGVRALRGFGYSLGMAFQIIDDILDLIGNEKILGKAVGSDLRCGNLSLPVIYALQHAPRREEISRLITSRNSSDITVWTIIGAVQECGGIEYADNIAERYLEKSLKRLEVLPKGDAVTAMRQMARLLAKRQY